MTEAHPVPVHQEQRTLRIVVVGVGGHGVVLCSRLIAETAVASGLHVAMSEVHGMAQRGGVVETTVVLNGGDCAMVPAGSADLLLATEPLEALRALPYVASSGSIIVWMSENPPVTVSQGGPGYPDRRRLINGLLSSGAALWTLDRCSSPSFPAGRVHANVALLGAALRSCVLPFGMKEITRVVSEVLPERHVESNLDSLGLGHDRVIRVVPD